ncbi:unnamed protein product, partial [Oppiella nova]
RSLCVGLGLRGEGVVGLQVLSISLIDELAPFQSGPDYSVDTLDTRKLCSNRSSLQELELLMKTSPETRI